MSALPDDDLPEVGDLNARRGRRGRTDRRQRQTLSPTHPKADPAVVQDVVAAGAVEHPSTDAVTTSGGTPAEPVSGASGEMDAVTTLDTVHDTGHDTSPDTADDTSDDTVAEQEPMPAVETTVVPVPVRSRAQAEEATPETTAVDEGVSATVPARAGTDEPLPDLRPDLADPAALLVSATQVNVPGDVLARFTAYRKASNLTVTGVVLEALRAHAAELPDLVRQRRPGGREGDLFPYRATPDTTHNQQLQPVRIRPTVGELKVIDRLKDWTNERVVAGRLGVREVSRSEVVTAALDAYLPAGKRRR